MPHFEQIIHVTPNTPHTLRMKTFCLQDGVCILIHWEKSNFYNLTLHCLSLYDTVIQSHSEDIHMSILGLGYIATYWQQDMIRLIP